MSQTSTDRYGFDHREYVTPRATYDTGADVFKLLLDQGLRPQHRLCDVGCGSLRVGRFLITYLERNNYYAIEPNNWLVEDAIKHEVGTLPIVKDAVFAQRTDFDIGIWGVRFDVVLLSAVLIHVDHEQLEQALHNTYRVLKPNGFILFDTYPNGPDHDTRGWLYPQIAPHYLECINAAKPSRSKLTMIGDTDYRGAQWWRLEA